MKNHFKMILYFACFVIIQIISMEAKNQKIIDFLNDVKDIKHEVLTKSDHEEGNFIYKIQPEGKTHSTSYLMGSCHFAETAWNSVDFTSPVEIIYLEQPSEKSASPDFIESQIEMQGYKRGKTFKYLDMGDDCIEIAHNAYEERDRNILKFFEENLEEKNFYLRNQSLVDYAVKIHHLSYKFHDPSACKLIRKSQNKLFPEEFNKILEEWDKNIIDPRTKLWMKLPNLLTDLETKNVLLVAGKDHLIGEFGLIQFLKKNNFNIEPIFPELTCGSIEECQKQYQEEAQELQNKMIEISRKLFQDSKIHVKIHDLKNEKYLHLNETYGIVEKLTYGEKNLMNVKIPGRKDPIMVKKENLTFVIAPKHI